MSDLISVRLDEDARRALAELEATGLSRSDAVRRSLVAAALRLRASTAARGASFQPEIDIGGTTTRVLVEQTGAIDVSRLGDHHGHLTPEEQWGVDLALETVLDLQ